MPSITISGTDYSYQITKPVANSRLPVLVFVHGWLLSHHYWQPVVDILQADYQCLRYDLRGFGTSRNIQNSVKRDYSLAAYAQDLCDFLARLKVENAWLIGHSLGGSIALWSADLAPQVIQGVIGVNSGGGIYVREEFAKFRNAGQQIVKFRPTWLPYIPGLSLIFSRMMVYRPISLNWARQRIIDLINADSEAALGSLLQTTTEEEVHYLPRLVSRLAQPVYFIAGQKDRIMEPKYVHHLASFHRLFDSGHGNVLELPECGHLAPLEVPVALAEMTLSIINKHL
ncbi:putative hydrolase or acyltransferase of alpha/beta superfamily [Xenococcus sp. PCC 7305]|uniref:alpha/beta fold hydrolase n=1 Tax=Xenococcus sp. PCC 7305 TaxID=102125 RepID=UPI0002AD181C|nr:alpha/beta hydrolase [Xenococcus sp. PCC 7305]ELS02095.1 putative hydrolase or acyltransferase of alpha/beta superfamily [Xenococcus sp. PCC 7305]